MKFEIYWKLKNLERPKNCIVVYKYVFSHSIWICNTLRGGLSPGPLLCPDQQHLRDQVGQLQVHRDQEEASCRTGSRHRRVVQHSASRHIPVRRDECELIGTKLSLQRAGVSNSNWLGVYKKACRKVSRAALKSQKNYNLKFKFKKTIQEERRQIP